MALRRSERLAEFFLKGGAVYVSPRGIATTGWWEIWTQERDGHPGYLFARSDTHTAYGDSLESSQQALNKWFEYHLRRFSFLNFLHVLTIPEGWHLVGGYESSNVWYAVISDDPADAPFRPSWVFGEGRSPEVTYAPGDCVGAGLYVGGGYVPPYNVGFVTWEGHWDSQPAIQYELIPEQRNTGQQARTHSITPLESVMRMVVVPDPGSGFEPVVVSVTRCAVCRVVFHTPPELLAELPTAGHERLWNTRRLMRRGLANGGEVRERKTWGGTAVGLATVEGT
ncbi:hypothetical protein [Deinococcus sp. YIM 77859]|uniref:hypothetical protein n=1 Tax=Deinococcus sp. YIM 77859 TaxID=1540221 RepID=UPI0012E01357|nr:hypothetical protein [Deinococcus sp. YIM 77859]